MTRGDSPQIIGNVFEAQNPQPEAGITVEVNANNYTFRWTPGAIGNDALKAIRVFDSSSAYHYVNKEDELGFKPTGLNLLAELTKAINQVKARVDEDIMPGNGLVTIPTLNSTTSAARFLNNLSSKSEESELEQYTVSSKEVESIEALRSAIIRDKMQTAESKKSSLNQQKELLTPLLNMSKDILRYLGDKAAGKLRLLQSDYIKKQKKADELKVAILKDLPLDTVAGVSWQAMWNAAKSFIEQEEKSHSFPPLEGDTCPFCLQRVSDTSAERLKSLSKFLADNAATEATDALKLVTHAVNLISSQSPSLKEHRAALIEFEKLRPGTEKRFELLFQQLNSRKPLFIDPSRLPESIDALDISVLEELKQLIESIVSEHENIKSNADLQKLIQKKETELQQIEDKKFVTENREAIISNIRRHKVITRMKALGRECSTRPVSTLASQIYQNGVVTPLLEAFSEELKQFGFIRFSVKAQTRNRSGTQQLKLVIEEGGEPLVSKIASEGEQRCIAIAAFLAEMKADHRKSAVIFDDPVNSLSHQWRSRVAERLVKESLLRQVIVFTHDIVFYKLLLEAAEEQNAPHGSCALERSRRGFAGIVRDSAPWEALTTSKRVKQLNAELQAVRRIDQNGTDSEFRRVSREFYGLLRESWERLIEEKLLNKVVNRFERAIQTKRLGQLTDISDIDVSKINAAMAKCSKYFTGHDSAPSVGDPYPTIGEMAEDLKQISEYLSELQGKDRKRT